MENEKKEPEGSNGNPEGDAAKLKAELDKLKADLSAKDSELSKLESIKTEMETTRQAAKERERKALEEQGQFKALAEQQAKELEELRKSISETQTSLSEMDALKAKADEYDAMLTRRREELMKLVPEDKKKALENASLEILEAFVDKPSVPGFNQRPRGTDKGPPLDFSKMSAVEQVKYARERKMTPAEIVEARAQARKR